MTSSTADVSHALRPEEKAALREYWRFYEPVSAAISEDLRRACEDLPVWGPLMRSMSAQQIAEQDKRSQSLQRAAIMDDQWGPYLADLHAQGAQYARAGVTFSSWFQLISLYRESMRKRLSAYTEEHGPQSLKVSGSVSAGMNRFLDMALAEIGEAYLATKEAIIVNQQEAIRELSTPVLQVRDRLLIIPVVGLVDTHRARLLTEGLLRAIRERRARGVVMDITGVPMVDSKVANHLVQACEAARLMGAMVVMTGIASEIAQTLVTIGAKLHGVKTMVDLQDGIEEVERFLGYRQLDARDGASSAALED
jgi:rsbT co-antagonist protein RsbR